GAALYFHHQWDSWETHAAKPFPIIKDHVLLPRASRIQEADELMKNEISEKMLREVVDLIPVAWLSLPNSDISPQEIKEIYLRYLTKRLEMSHSFTKEINDARQIHL
ncbi:MAG TPA: aminotransferase class I and II, partial [Saprospiraceae bacterium]|nr:aminotransferase class I and II [Saprospiraceae bacterium]